MALSVTYTDESSPKDVEVGVQGLGLLPNGKAVKLKEEDEQAFVNAHGMTVKEWAKDSEYMKVEGTSELKKGGE